MIFKFPKWAQNIGYFFRNPQRSFFSHQKRIHDRPNFSVKRDLAGLQLTLTGNHIAALDCDTSFQKSI